MTSDLERAAGDYRGIKAAFRQAREKLAQEIVKADANGMRQVDIVRITGYTREHVRRIVADAKQS